MQSSSSEIPHACCCEDQGPARNRAGATGRIRHETAAVSPFAPLTPASRSPPVAAGCGDSGRPHLVGGAPRGGRPQSRVAGHARGGCRRGAPPAPPLPRAQLPVPDRPQGWSTSTPDTKPHCDTATSSIAWTESVIVLLSLLQGACGDASCFMISNVDGSSKGGAEILYASLPSFMCTESLPAL